MSSFDRVAINRHKNNNKRIAKEIVIGKKSKNCDKELNISGYDRDIVNDRINTMIRKRMNMSIQEVAEEVVEGKWEDEISLFGGNYISVTIKINNNILTS